ncbi:DUF4349 domain-containing protein [Microbacterium caowuchunii]|uniref:DUF4349 domain-containing protein n=1 Tax=Microbacterium caowuchunii TaxID=2614638 RepID=UPI001247BCBA|nr:DUF4349 domain-containing protein [Microbacterium caowuchunii]QEV99803.1 DUF4349 domain-containing protein [Microbacterium caowuchunii]
MNQQIAQNEQTLPEAPDTAQVARMEASVMGRIREDRSRRRVRRVRMWGGAAAVAAVVALAAIISPAVLSGIGGAASSTDGTVMVAPAAEPFPLLEGPAMDEGMLEGRSAGGAAESADMALEGATGRDVIANGWVQLTVDDVEATTDRVTALAVAEGGYVESANLGRTGPLPADRSMPVVGGESWITIRVPADRLTAVVDEVSGFGEVTATSIDRTDVTTQTVDLRARITAQEESVARLTELLGQAGSVADLIAAESALAERQAQLDADRQQLQLLETQVAMSSLTVTLSRTPETVTADPAGFGDGLSAGWNGLVATLNGTVVALGFLLPWLVLVGVIVLAVWGIRTLVVRRRHRGTRAGGSDVSDG